MVSSSSSLSFSSGQREEDKDNVDESRQKDKGKVDESGKENNLGERRHEDMDKEKNDEGRQVKKD